MLPGIVDTTADCHIGIEFAPNYLGVLEEVNFFMGYFDVTLIVDQLHIQASSDNFNQDIVTLHIVGEEAHEGWNYFDMKETTFYEEN